MPATASPPARYNRVLAPAPQCILMPIFLASMALYSRMVPFQGVTRCFSHTLRRAARGGGGRAGQCTGEAGRGGGGPLVRHPNPPPPAKPPPPTNPPHPTTTCLINDCRRESYCSTVQYHVGVVPCAVQYSAICSAISYAVPYSIVQCSTSWCRPGDVRARPTGRVRASPTGQHCFCTHCLIALQVNIA